MRRHAHTRALTPARAAHRQAFGGSRRIVDREDDYRKRRLNRVLSPTRNDAMTMARAPRMKPRLRARR